MATERETDPQDTLTAAVNIRLLPTQRDDWQRRADAEGRNLSNWVRRQVEKQIREKALPEPGVEHE